MNTKQSREEGYRIPPKDKWLEVTGVWLRMDMSSREQGKEGASARDEQGLGQITAHTEWIGKRVSNDGYLDPQVCVGNRGSKGDGT